MGRERERERETRSGMMDSRKPFLTRARQPEDERNGRSQSPSEIDKVLNRYFNGHPLSDQRDRFNGKDRWSGKDDFIAVVDVPSKEWIDDVNQK